MFAPEMKIEKFEMVDVITTSEPTEEPNDCTYQTACAFD